MAEPFSGGLGRKQLILAGAGAAAGALALGALYRRRSSTSGRGTKVEVLPFGAPSGGGIVVEAARGVEGLLALHRAATCLCATEGCSAADADVRVVDAEGTDIAVRSRYPPIVYATTAQPMPRNPVPMHPIFRHLKTMAQRGPGGEAVNNNLQVNIGEWLVKLGRDGGPPLVPISFPGGAVPFDAFTGDPGIARCLYADSRVWRKIFTKLPRDGDEALERRCPIAAEHLISGLGRGLFILDHDDPRWGCSRRLLGPSMGAAAMKGYFPAVLAKSDELMVELDRLADGTEVDLYGWTSRITFDSIAICGFGIELGNIAQARNNEIDPFLKGLRTSFGIAKKRVANKWYGPSGKYPWWLKWTKENHQFETACSGMMATILKCIEDRKAGLTKSILKGPDLLDLMLEGTDPQSGQKLPESNIWEQVSNFLLAGHETTSSNISQILYLFSKYPHCQERALQEAREVLKGKDHFDDKDVNKLKYIDACMRESLRLFPPISATPRMCFEAAVVTSKNGRSYLLPRHTQIAINHHALHMDPDQWGTEPWRFDPEHWTDPARVAARHPDCWHPFGGGDRQCIGQAFSIMETKLLVAMLLLRYEFRHTPGKTATYVNSFTNALHYLDESTGKPEPSTISMTIHRRGPALRPCSPGPVPTLEAVALPRRLLGHVPLLARDPAGEDNYGHGQINIAKWALRRGTGIAGPVRRWDSVTGSGFPAYVVTDPEVTKQLFGNPRVFRKVFTKFSVDDPALERRCPFGAEHLISSVGRGLFLLDHDDPRWGIARRVLNPAMGFSAMKGYYPAVLSKADELMGELDRLDDGANVEVYGWMSRITFDSIAVCGFGIDLGNIAKGGSDGSTDPFLDGMRTSFHIAKGRLKSKIYGPAGKYPWWLKWTPQNKVFEAANTAMRATIQKCINDRIAGRTRSVLQGPDLLDLMLEAEDAVTGRKIPESNVWEQISNLLIAGHETTSANITHCLYLLSKNPKCAAAALKEARQVLAGKDAFANKDINKLKYIDACLRESLRLFPPISITRRVAFEDAVIETVDGNRYLVPKGADLQINKHALHMRADQWGPHPERFDPEHWTDSARTERRHPDAWHPFGGGDRQCIGQQFSLMEAKLILAMLLDRYEFRHIPGDDPVLVNTFTNGLYVYDSQRRRPTGDMMRMTVHKRKGQDGRDVIFYPDQKSTEEAATVTSVFGVDYPPRSPKAAESTGGMANGFGGVDSAEDEDKGAPDTDFEVPGAGCPVLVLYGSNMGACEDFAHQLEEIAKAKGHNPVECKNLDAQIAKDSDLPREGVVLIVASTYNGLPPDNAAKFEKWMRALKPASMAGVRYAVFGTGNRQWKATFQLFPTQIDDALKAAGAARIVRRGASDADGDEFEESFTEWVQSLKAVVVGCGDGISGVHDAAAVAVLASKWEMSMINDEQAERLGGTLKASDLQLWTSKTRAAGSVGPLMVKAQRELQGEGSDRSTVHVEVELPEGESYVCGEHLEVCAENPPELVVDACAQLGVDPSAKCAVKIKDDRFRLIRPSETAPCPVGAILRLIPDLSAPLTKKGCSALAALAQDEAQKAKLFALAGGDGFEAFAPSRGLTLLESLREFPSVSVTPDMLVALLPPLKPRHYSISSSPLGPQGARRATVTVGQVAYSTGTGRRHRGLCSTLLGCRDGAEWEQRRPFRGKEKDAPPADFVLGRVKSLSTGFRLPEDPTVPIVMVGPGTGLAPMLGFLQHREALLAKGGKLGPAVLFFGFRKAEHDYIYQEQLEGWAAGGKVLTSLRIAESRPAAGGKKQYVQDLVREDGASLWELLHSNDKSRVYICGDAKYMAPDVRVAFKAVAQQHGGKSGEQAEWWLGSLLNSGRYLEDVWAAS